MSDKVKIRSKLLKLRSGIDPKERLSKNRRIARQLESLECFVDAHHVLFYYSHNSEVDTLELIDRHIDDKQLYLPVIKTKFHLQAIPVKRPLDLQKGFEGIPEPRKISPNSVYDKNIQVAIIPAVGVDKKGNRLGMGKGYYDRYFERNKKVIKIALAYEEQILDRIPKDPYNEAIDLIVTDQAIYRC